MKAKHLSKGDARRLSIAEEIVHGPSLLLIDEPTTNVEIKDISTMLTAFREMVNDEKTVIATMHNPTYEAFKVFDTLMLLSRGRVIYHGPVEGSQDFFINSPFAFNNKGYENAADYLLEISAGGLKDVNGNTIGAAELSGYYENSELFVRSPQQIDMHEREKNEATNGKNVFSTDSSYLNPLQSGENDGTRRTSSIAMNQGLEGAREGSNAMSFDIERANRRSVNNIISQPKSVFKNLFYWRTITILTQEYIKSVLKMDVRTYLWKTGVLLERSTMALLRRAKLVLATSVLFICLAAVLGGMLGNTSLNTFTSILYIEIVQKPVTIHGTTYEYNTTAFFAISMLLLVLCNVQLIFYLMKSNEVFYNAFICVICICIYVFYIYRYFSKSMQGD